MKKVNHKFFGELDLEKGLEAEIDFENDLIVLWDKDVNEINTTLWYDKNIPVKTEILDAFADFLNRFDEYNKKARKALEKYLLEDNEYIVFHREEVELDLPENAEKFVEFIKVTNIGLWLDGENGIIVDYMISPEDTDEILAVKFDYSLEIVDIAWES
ncbi:DUF2004 domain-containing protein [Haemophilus haemoglobinophilus]|nr:DUF2004 domain-containing protein [Canicola haemoglobinophilus]MBN6711861.1 DUF2004 domain-containing protein [Canicola haemoglobinophilus]